MTINDSSERLVPVSVEIVSYQDIVDLWQGWNISSVQDLELRLDNFRVIFAYHSGKIENESVDFNDTREIFENGRAVAFTGDPRTLFEQQNQKLCYEYLKEKIIRKDPVSVDLIKEIHRILTSGTYDEHRFIDNDERPGEFKKHDYVTGIHEVGSSPEEVEQDIRELVAEVNEYGAKDPLKAAAYFHASFEFIHPFADGNGRVGRTLMNYWLMINDYPPTVIYEDDRKAYYAALTEYDEKEELEPLILFIKEETVRTWKRNLETGRKWRR